MRGWLTWLRASIIGILIGLGCLALGAYAMVHWVERQILTPDNWVSMVAPLPKQPTVSTALGGYIGKQVFAAVPVEQEISNALPPRASFLAGPLTSQLNDLTTKTAQKMVASDGFQTVWISANRVAINRLVAVGRNQTPPLQARLNQKFDINLSGASGQLSTALGSASNAIPALQPANQKIIAVQTDLHARRQRLRDIIRGVDFLAAVLPLFVTACLLWALALARNRRRTSLAIGLVAAIVMLVELIILKGLRQSLLTQIQDPANLNAIGYIYDTLTGLLKHTVIVVLVVALAVCLVCIVVGPAKWAKTFHRSLHTEYLAKSRMMSWWYVARLWMKQHQYYVWLGIILAVLTVVALVSTVSWRVMSNALLMILSLFALTRIIATPPSHANKQTAR